MSSPVLFIIAALIWGSTFWAITVQLGDVAPAVSVLYRFGLASATLFACCRWRGDRLRLPWRIWCAAAVAMGGVTMLFYPSIRASWQDILDGGSGKFLLGFGLALAATISSSIGNAVVVKVRQQSSNALLTMAWSMLWGSTLVALWALAGGQPWRLPSSPGYWAGLLYLAIFGSVIAFNAYFTLIDRIGSQKAVYVGVVTPIVSVLLSVQLEHYRPGPGEWAGMVLCLASVAWALRANTPLPAKAVTSSHLSEAA